MQIRRKIMCINHAVNDLGLTDANDTCDCGHDHGTVGSEASSADLVRTQLAVDGMTCSHCVASVTEELSTLDGVESVDVQLNAGGTSKVVVTSASELDPVAIQAAIDEAGYSLVEA
jgi:copper chaperone